MIYIECRIIDLKTRKSKATYMKSFAIHDEFNKWYDLAKKDSDFLMNIMYYNPNEKPGQKAVFDVKLLSMGRGNVT